MISYDYLYSENESNLTKVLLYFYKNIEHQQALYALVKLLFCSCLFVITFVSSPIFAHLRPSSPIT